MRPGFGFDPPPGLDLRVLRVQLARTETKATRAINALRVIEEGTHPDPQDYARRVLLELAQDEADGE